MMSSRQAPRASGYSARLLEAGWRAVALAQDCPCGRHFLDFIKGHESLKELRFRLCRKGHSRKWLQPLLEAGIVWWTTGCGKRSVTIYLETPLQVGVARLKREQLKREV